MEAVPRMPMIWLELKEAGEFEFSPTVKQYIHINYGENPENYSESLKRLEQLRQTVVNIPRDFEGCSTLRKYLGQLHFLQSRVPMATGQEAAVPVTWVDVFSGRNVTHNDINYEQTCVLYNLGALHSILGTLDNRMSEEGMKVSCTHFQCAAGAFTYLRDHYNHSYSSDMDSQTLSINISLMLAQAQECLLEKTLLDNRKSHLIAKICAQVCNYYKDCLRVLDHSECVPGRIQKEWRKLISLKMNYFSAITHLHMGKQSEEQQKFGEAVAYFQFSLDRLNEAIKQGKSQPDSVQDALKFTMDVIGGKYNSAKKDNDFIYHESVPNVDTLAAVKGATLVKPLPVTPTDPSVTGPDLFSKLVPMATHEASSLYSEEKAKLLRDIVAKIEDKNQALERFMESLSSDSVYKVDMFKTLPDTLLEKCAYLSVRPDTVKNLVQAMQALSNVYTDVGSSLEEIRSALEEDKAGEKSLMEVVGQKGLPPRSPALQEIQQELKKYEAAHEAASQTNTELHRAMNQHIPNLRLLQGSVEDLRNSLPQPQLSQDDTTSLQKIKTILFKVDEMRKQRILLESQLRDLIHKDDITGVLVTADRAEIKMLFVEQLKKYDQLKGYIEQNLLAQGNILKALTDANVQYAPVRKMLIQTEQQWNSTVQSLISSFEAYEDLIKKAEEGRDFYQDMDKKTSSLLEKTKAYCQTRENEQVALLEKDIGKGQPSRLATQKSLGGQKVPVAPFIAGQDLHQELRGLPPNTNFAGGPMQPNPNLHGGSLLTWPRGASPFPSPPFPNPQVSNTDSKPTQLTHHLPQNHTPYVPSPGIPQQFQVRSPGGTAPFYPQAHPPTTSQVPIQGYNPALWQQQHGGPVVVSGGYTVPPQLPQNCIRPGVPNMIGQPSSAHQIIQGAPYQSFAPQPRQNIPPDMPRSAFPGQILPPFQPGQFQPPGYRPELGPHPQPQHGQLPVSQHPGAPITHPQSQFHPGQLPQGRPQPYMGYPPTSFASSQPQPISAPPQNPLQVQPQVPLSQNAQVPFGVRPPNQPQMPQGAVPPQNNMYSFRPPHMGQQTLPPQFHIMPNGTGRQAMYTPPGQSQIPGYLSGQSAVPVMDNPVPLSLASTLIPTPSPAHVSAPQLDTINPQSKGSCPQKNAVLDSLQIKVDNLSITSQSEASDFGSDQSQNLGAHLSKRGNGSINNTSNCADAVCGGQDTIQSTISIDKNGYNEQGVDKKDPFGDLDPLWSPNNM